MFKHQAILCTCTASHGHISRFSFIINAARKCLLGLMREKSPVIAVNRRVALKKETIAATSVIVALMTEENIFFVDLCCSIEEKQVYILSCR